jgi:PAS domain S-box-containing protein
LADRETLLRSALDALATHVAVLDLDGVILAVNEAWRRFADDNGFGEPRFGVGENYLVVCEQSMHGGGTDEGRVAAGGIRAVAAGEIDRFTIDYPCHPPHGERWFQMCVTRATSPAGARLVVAHEDITERKRGDERHRAFIEHSSEAIWRFELAEPLSVALDEQAQIDHAYQHARLAECNDATARMYGYERAADLIGAPLTRLLPRDDPSNVEYLRRFVASGYRLTDAESHEVARDGSPRFFLNNLIGMVVDGHLVRAWGTQRDVTRLKLAEVALRDSERKLRLALDAAGLGIWELHADGSRTLSDTYVDVVGAAPTTQDGYLDIVHPDDRSELVARVQTAVRERGSYRYEYRVQPPGAAERWVAGYGRVVRSDGGNPDRMIGVVMDVTARRQAETQREEARRSMQLALAVARAGVWEWQVATNRVLGDESLARLFGIGHEDIVAGGVSVERFRAPIHPDDLQRVDRAMQPILTAGGEFESEFRVLGSDRAPRWVAARGKVELDASGALVRLTGLVFDVTAQKESERDAAVLVELGERIRTVDDARELCTAVERLLDERFDETHHVLAADTGPDAGEAGAGDTAGFASQHDRLLSRDAIADLHAGRTVVVNERDLSAAKPGERARGVSALVAVPRLGETGWSFTLFAVAGRPREWRAHEIALLETVAERTWNAVEKLRLAARLRVSEQRYRSLVSATAAIVGVTDPEGRFVAAQPGWEAYTGQSWDEHGGYGYLNAIHPDDREAAAHAWQTARDEGAVFEYEARLRHAASDSYRYCVARVIPVRNAAGAIREWVSSIVDVDEQRRAEMRIRASDAEWRLVFESARDFAIFTLAADRRVTRWNPGATRLLGYEDAEIIGQVADVLFTPEDRAALVPEQEVASVLTSGRAEDERWHLRKDGSRFWASGLMMPLANERGETIGFVKIMRDMTVGKWAAEEREELLRIAERARADAESASRAKDDFLATLSHELRSPLQAAMGWAALLRSGNLSGVQLDKAVKTVERSIRHQVRLVDDLLDVSRILTGKLHLETTTVDLVLVIEQLREEMQVDVRGKGLDLVVAVERCGTVLGDAQRITQIFRNLLTNAIKFTPAGGRIEIVGCDRDDGVVVAVSDTGQGIAADFLPHIFDRFSQADSSMTRQHGGLGLGLGIVRHLVQMHGGSIAAESAGVGEGATFRVRLPHGASTPGDQSMRIAGESGAGSLRGVLVGLVDDDANARDALALLLQEIGARVVTASSAHEALNLFSSARPDVIVSDLGMPDHDGFWLARELRALGSTVPMIALSGFAAADVKARVLAEGFRAHVSKPAGRRELAESIANVLEVHR